MPVDLYDGFAGTVSAPAEGPAATGAPAVAPRKAAGGNLHFHGSPGDPGYPSLHPKGGAGKAKRKVSRRGWIGSDQYSEEDHYAAVTRYIDESVGINSWLRHGEVQHDDLEDDEAEQYARTIMDLIEVQEPNPVGTFMYRGMRSENAPKNLKVGDEFHDRGFTSTTESLAVARDFSGSEGVMFKIKIPKGVKILNVDAIEATDPQRIERENILQAGTRFRVTGIRKPLPNGVPGGYDLEVIQ